jgi:hypothetical protein
MRRQDIGVLADATRCWWGINPHSVETHGIEHAVAVYGGVTRALFRILPDSWEQLKERRRGFCAEPIMTGALFDDVVGRHGHRVPAKARGDQSQFHFWPRPGAMLETPPDRSRSAKARCSAFQVSVSFVITGAESPTELPRN